MARGNRARCKSWALGPGAGGSGRREATRARVGEELVERPILRCGAEVEVVRSAEVLVRNQGVSTRPSLLRRKVNQGLVSSASDDRLDVRISRPKIAATADQPPLASVGC